MGSTNFTWFSKKRKNKSIISKTLLSECILNKESFNLAYMAGKKNFVQIQLIKTRNVAIDKLI